MSTPTKTRGTVMMAIGIVMILGSVIIMLAMEEPLPVGFGVIGLVFVAVGARYRRTS